MHEIRIHRIREEMEEIVHTEVNDPESDHILADRLLNELLILIAEAGVTAATRDDVLAVAALWQDVSKWYA